MSKQPVDELITGPDGVMYTVDGLQREIALIQEWFHKIDDDDQGWRMRPDVTARQVTRYLSLLSLLGVEGDVAEAAAAVLSAPLTKQRRGRTPYSLTINGELELPVGSDESEAGVFSGGIVPEALRVPGPEVAYEEDSELADVDGDEFTDDADETGREVRAANLYWQLYREQTDLKGKGLDVPFSSRHGFAQWLFTRVLLHGFDAVRGYRESHREIETWVSDDGELMTDTRIIWDGPYDFASVLAEAFPGLAQPDAATMKRLVRHHRLLKQQDGPELVARAQSVDKRVADAVGALCDAYSTLVDASRAVRQSPADDLPRVRRLNLVKDGWQACRLDVAHALRVVGGTDEVARAFGVSGRRLRAAMVADVAPLHGAVRHARRRY